MIYENILRLIGNTPIVEINKLNPSSRVKICAKLEYYHPTGSLKDRIAISMIKDAERKGLLKNKIVLEATSGNTGISLAWVCSLLGYKSVFVIPKSTSPEKQAILKAFGAKLIFTSTEEDAVKKARELAKDSRYLLIDQFANEANWKAHYQTTGEEIWKQTEGKVTHVIAGIGTGGTLMGIARRLKEYNSKIKAIGVIPTKHIHKQEGLLSLKKFIPEILKLDEVDEIVRVKDRDAVRMMCELISREGLPVGISSGSIMYAALKIVKKLREGLIVCIFADNAFRYLHLLQETVKI